jgi:hypothetical protein
LRKIDGFKIFEVGEGLPHSIRYLVRIHLEYKRIYGWSKVLYSCHIPTFTDILVYYLY